jgi:very-short-patch-repair endonuclease
MRASARALSEVTVARKVRSRPDVQIHCSDLPSDEVTEHDGIPVTSVPRTLLDLAAVLTPAQVERAMNEAEIKRLGDALSLDDLLRRYPGRRGTRAIMAILHAARAGATRTRSDLEEAFIGFLESNRLPRPETNVWVRAGARWFEVDCLWRDQGVIAELDGRAVHHTAAAFERDRARDRALSVARWRPIRITWRHLHQGAESLEADLRSMLGAQAFAARPQWSGGPPERLGIVA